MKFDNRTEYSVEELFEAAVDGYEHSGLLVEIKYCPKNSGRHISGTYYRQCPGHENGLFIRLRINQRNRYPVRVAFKTSEYYSRIDSKGREVIYQKLRYEKFRNAEGLLLAIFLHEFSHYLDHIEGRNGRYKQTKADKFAIDRLKAVGFLKGK